MDVIQDKSELRARCDAARAKGQRVGLVPTMGALHEGHLALVRGAMERGADFVVVTIFVNPLQFGQGEDLAKYPRPLERDVELCEREGAALVFAPRAGTMYPDGFQTHVEVERITRPLEGEHRAGHFRGVTTIVTKLFNIVGPCVAVFGRKDFQQLRVIDRMVRDLDMPVEIVKHPIVREPDGLARSSRNRYLNEDERARALSLSRALREVKALWDNGERDQEALIFAARQHLTHANAEIDYVSLVDAETLLPPDETSTSVQALIAAHIGTTRLIDNITLV